MRLAPYKQQELNCKTKRTTYNSKLSNTCIELIKKKANTVQPLFGNNDMPPNLQTSPILRFNMSGI